MFHRTTGKILWTHGVQLQNWVVWKKHTMWCVAEIMARHTAIKNLILAAKYGEGGNIVSGWFMPQGLDRCLSLSKHFAWKPILKTESADLNLIDMLWYDLMRAIHINQDFCWTAEFCQAEWSKIAPDHFAGPICFEVIVAKVGSTGYSIERVTYFFHPAPPPCLGH